MIKYKAISNTKINDLTGQKIGRLTVICLSETRTKRNKIMWDCICDCGNTKSIAADMLNKTLRGQIGTKSCGCLQNNAHNKIKDREIALLKVQYFHLKRRNKKMGFDDVIDFETFANLSKSHCKYCGLEYSKEIEDRLNESKNSKRVSDHILKCNGIDRINNKKGYTKDNSVACCKYCNFAKHTMTEDDFYKWIKRVYEYNF